MGVPDGLLPHQVTIVHPQTTTDAYGSQAHDYGPAASRTTVAGWLQQDTGTEPRDGGRDPQVGTWLLITNHAAVTGVDRIEWVGPAGPVVFEVLGPPAPTYTPAGFHHSECVLRQVQG